MEVVDAEGNKYDYPLFEIEKRKKVKSCRVGLGGRKQQALR